MGRPYGLDGPAGGAESYSALTVVYRKDSVRQLEGGEGVERLIDVAPVIEWENCRAPPGAGQEES